MNEYFSWLKYKSDDEVKRGDFVVISREVTEKYIREHLMTFSDINVYRCRVYDANDATSDFEIG